MNYHKQDEEISNSTDTIVYYDLKVDKNLDKNTTEEIDKKVDKNEEKISERIDHYENGQIKEK